MSNREKVKSLQYFTLKHIHTDMVLLFIFTKNVVVIHFTVTGFVSYLQVINFFVGNLWENIWDELHSILVKGVFIIFVKMS